MQGVVQSAHRADDPVSVPSPDHAVYQLEVDQRCRRCSGDGEQTDVKSERTDIGMQRKGLRVIPIVVEECKVFDVG